MRWRSAQRRWVASSPPARDACAHARATAPPNARNLVPGAPLLQVLSLLAHPRPPQREAELRGNLRQASKELKQLRAQGKATAEALAAKERELAAAAKVGHVRGSQQSSRAGPHWQPCGKGILANLAPPCSVCCVFPRPAPQAVAAAKNAAAPGQASRDKHGVEVAAVVALSVLLLAGGVATAVCRAN